MRFFRTLAIVAPLTAGVVGCNENNFKGAPVPPVAVINSIPSGPAYPGDEDQGIDPFVFNINGQDSYDPNSTQGNGIYEYEWTIESGPAGAIANVDGWGVADFTTDTPGNYMIGLRVRDINDFVWSEKET